MIFQYSFLGCLKDCQHANHKIPLSREVHCFRKMSKKRESEREREMERAGGETDGNIKAFIITDS